MEHSAHSIYIAHRIGRRNGPVIVGIINDRREEVGGQDYGRLSVNFINGRVIRAVQANQEPFIIDAGKYFFQRTYNLRQGLRVPFGRSAGGGSHSRQA